jgi:hypothetical protein
MSFCSINIFLDSWFDKQNANENSIHYRNSQQNKNKPTKKHWKDIRKTTKYEKIKTLKQYKMYSKKQFWIEIWSMMNYNPE